MMAVPAHQTEKADMTFQITDALLEPVQWMNMKYNKYLVQLILEQ